MNLQQKVAQKHQSPGGEMLLVRNKDILSTMVRIPIVVIGLILEPYVHQSNNPLLLVEPLILPFIRMAQLMFFMS